MNKKIFFVLPMSVLAVACAQEQLAEKNECYVVTVPDVCTGSATNPVLGITLVRNGIVVAPPNVCANPGTTINVSIQPPQSETGTVETVPKNPAHTWLARSNNPDTSSFTIDVPPNVNPGDYFDYTIIRSNGVCLDPRIHVPPGG